MTGLNSSRQDPAVEFCNTVIIIIVTQKAEVSCQNNEHYQLFKENPVYHGTSLK